MGACCLLDSVLLPLPALLERLVNGCCRCTVLLTDLSCCQRRCQLGLAGCKAQIEATGGTAQFIELDWSSQPVHLKRVLFGHAATGWAEGHDLMVLVAADCVWAETCELFLHVLEQMREMNLRCCPEVQVCVRFIGPFFVIVCLTLVHFGLLLCLSLMHFFIPLCVWQLEFLFAYKTRDAAVEEALFQRLDESGWCVVETIHGTEAFTAGNACFAHPEVCLYRIRPP